MTCRCESLSFATHNLWDRRGLPTFVADVMLFTEAYPPTIRARARAKASRSAARLAGFRVVVCGEQRSLVVAYRRRLLAYTGRRYRRAHAGRAKVTPRRGTFTVHTRCRSCRRHVALVVEHRINAAFPPYKRGHAEQRRKLWEAHTALTLQHLRRLDRAGWLFLAGGDLNTPGDVSGYEGAWSEAGSGYDRLASNRPLGSQGYGPRHGSDHRLLFARLAPRRKK